MREWRGKLFRHSSGRPRLMGVINVTPDSFFPDSRTVIIGSKNLQTNSGGSKLPPNYLQPNTVIGRAKMFIDGGADWLDVGGESTRPGASPVAIEEELIRVVPAITAIREAYPDVAISVDTRHIEVAAAALDAGADMVNDVSGLSDPRMRDLVIERGCMVCIMHMRGVPQGMQDDIEYDDVISEVTNALLKTADDLVDRGHPVEAICLDPGIGFGKGLADNLALLSDECSRLLRAEKGYSLLWGVSRKSMFGDLLQRVETAERLAGTLAVAAHAQSLGIDVLRVHDMIEHYDVGRTLAAFGSGNEGGDLNE
jgi:dihydropteroate synthase